MTGLLKLLEPRQDDIEDSRHNNGHRRCTAGTPARSVERRRAMNLETFLVIVAVVVAAFFNVVLPA